MVSAGQYGTNLNQLVFTVDTATGRGAGQDARRCSTLKTGHDGQLPVRPATAEIVDDGGGRGERARRPVRSARSAGPFNRAKLANGTTENRGGESTLGNLVAEVQRWATETPEAGAAQIAFMNPGGLRADMVGDGSGPTRGR